MHGRLKIKTTKEKELELKIQEREKAHHFNQLKEKLFELRPNISTVDELDEFYKLSHELLIMNPDFYTVWNIRREVLLHHVERISALSEDSIKENDHEDDNKAEPNQDYQSTEIDRLWKGELSFTLDCLMKNEKSYSAWQHRLWVLARMPRSQYEKEIILCNSFLSKDERNFHCWDYRSYICDIISESIENELKFTCDKIRSNFSNFSAWHRRHKVLIKALSLSESECPQSCNLRVIWPGEYNMILNAIFTDPNDQSPWLYHNWLVKNNFGHLNPELIGKLKELQKLEPDNKRIATAIELSIRHCDKHQNTEESKI